jgi:hypothetical protein
MVKELKIIKSAVGGGRFWTWLLYGSEPGGNSRLQAPKI